MEIHLSVPGSVAYGKPATLFPLPAFRKKAGGGLRLG
jgi:hypothetical protein